MPLPLMKALSPVNEYIKIVYECMESMADKPIKSIENIFKEDGRYPLEAVEFIREGLGFTVDRYLNNDEGQLPDSFSSSHPRHVTGAQLCQGLRGLAQKRWGFLARQVLNRWNITSTNDFGQIVFLLVDNGWMQKQPHDCVEDFDNVFDFQEAFDRSYEINLDQ